MHSVLVHLKCHRSPVQIEDRKFVPIHEDIVNDVQSSFNLTNIYTWAAYCNTVKC